MYRKINYVTQTIKLLAEMGGTYRKTETQVEMCDACFSIFKSIDAGAEIIK